jgi:hypothetical protein
MQWIEKYSVVNEFHIHPTEAPSIPVATHTKTTPDGGNITSFRFLKN